MSLKSVAELLQECFEKHCHEGEFNLFGKKITVFTREPEYQLDENNCPMFDKEPISYGGHKCAFIDDTYWTGWYCPDIGNDLKYCMEDVTKKLFESVEIKFTIIGSLKETIFPKYIENYIPEDWYDKEVYCHDPEESGNYKDEELLEAFKTELNYCFKVDETDIKSLNIIELDRTNHSFKVEVTLNNYILYDFFKDEDTLVSYNEWSSNYHVINSISCSFEYGEEINKYMKEAFSYSISF